MSFFAFSESTLSIKDLARVDICRARLMHAYAARFCALRLDCAGVRFSFSSLLPRLSCDMSPKSFSMSNAIPLSTLPLGKSESCCAGGDDDVEPAGLLAKEPLWPSEASKV